MNDYFFITHISIQCLLLILIIIDNRKIEKIKQENLLLISELNQLKDTLGLSIKESDKVKKDNNPEISIILTNK